MTVSPWEVLGLAPGSDRSSIRRRYAQRLREVSQQDTQAFQTLRLAYEACLALEAAATGDNAPLVNPRPPEPAAAVSAPQAAPAPSSESADETEDEDGLAADYDPGEGGREYVFYLPASCVDAIRAWLPRFRPLQADAEELAAEIGAFATSLSLDEREAFEHALAVALASEEHLSMAALGETAKVLEWNDVSLRRRGGVFAYPPFRLRLTAALQELRAPLITPGWNLSLWGQLWVGFALSVVPAWIVFRLLRHFFGGPAGQPSLLDHLLADRHLLWLWLLVWSALLLRWLVLKLRR